MTIRSLSAAVVSIAVVTNTPVMTFALERNWMGRRHAPKGTGHLCFENYLEQILFNTFHSLEIVKKMPVEKIIIRVILSLKMII